MDLENSRVQLRDGPEDEMPRHPHPHDLEDESKVTVVLQMQARAQGRSGPSTSSRHGDQILTGAIKDSTVLFFLVRCNLNDASRHVFHRRLVPPFADEHSVLFGCARETPHSI